MTEPDRPKDQQDAWLDSLTDEELVEVAASADDLAAAIARSRLQRFAASRVTRFGWFVDENGEIAVDAGCVTLPSALIDVVGPPEAADDAIELVPVGSPGGLTAVRATWHVYRPDQLTAVLKLRAPDGAEWPLRPVPGGYGLDLPADLATQVEDDELATYEVELVVTVAPLDDDLVDVNSIERLVGEWADSVPTELADRDPRSFAPNVEAVAEPVLSRGGGGLDLPNDVAQRLGIYRHVSWGIEGTELVVVVVPDPDAEADLSDRIIVAAVDSRGGVVASGRFELGDTAHTCRLPVGDSSLFTKVVLNELADG